jgi:IS30 family transposase
MCTLNGEQFISIAQRVNRVTYDNGKKFGGYAVMDEALKSTAYFAVPFANRQRGSNENLKGLLRLYIPKQRSLLTLTVDELKMSQDRLN